MSTKFYLDNETEKIIIQDFTKYQLLPGIEIEVRIFKEFDGNKKVSISKQDYEKLLKIIPTRLNIKPYDSYSTVEIFQQRDHTIRKITEGDEILYQTKKSLVNIDSKYKDFDFRLSVSQETTLQNIPKNLGYPKVVRRRTRTEYDMSTYKYVLTKVEENKKINHELEIEFSPEYPIKPNDIEFIMETILDVLIGEEKKISYIPLSLEYYIREFYDTLGLREIKPRNLLRRDVSELLKSKFSVTNKLDGERFIILCSEDGTFAINKRTVEMVTKYDQYDSTFVYDAELFDGYFYIFDCLLYKGKRVSDIPHLERIKLCKGIENENYLFTVKEFSTDIKSQTISLLKNLPREFNDGLIYTSKMGDEVFKWKFPEKMTLDFLVKFVGMFGKQYVYKLFLGEKHDRVVQFTGSMKFPITHDAVYFSEEKLKEDGIYELGYDLKNKKFIMFRERPEKVVPNFYPTTGISVWADIIDPFTEKELIDLFGVKLVEYRKWHNKIKGGLISEYCSGKKILDLGSGNGGDLGKYDRAGIKFLWAVEPDPINYTEFKKRLTESFSHMKNKIMLLEGYKAQDTEKVLKIMDKEKADVVCSFFSLSFFFFQKPNGIYQDLDSLVNTVRSTLNDDGRFIGTTIDGERTKKLLSEHDGKFEFEGGSYTLLDDGSIELSQEGTIVRTQIESLVDFPLLVKKLKKFGIVLEHSEFFQPSQDLSKTENMVNSLYRTFSFKKIGCPQKILEIVYGYSRLLGINKPEDYSMGHLRVEIINKHKGYKKGSDKLSDIVDIVVKKYSST